ncbi:hypothetical protein F4780DRAFT_19629 [Xylariomycetidae sp. FL0641]|nr:hypothetical protein F4780DRAFT_19629 [Xylariomycetidae sp. FL0641]
MSHSQHHSHHHHSHHLVCTPPLSHLSPWLWHPSHLFHSCFFASDLSICLWPSWHHPLSSMASSHGLQLSLGWLQMTPLPVSVFPSSCPLFTSCLHLLPAPPVCTRLLRGQSRSYHSACRFRPLFSPRRHPAPSHRTCRVVPRSYSLSHTMESLHLALIALVHSGLVARHH